MTHLTAEAPGQSMEWEDEEAWLRGKIVRLRAILRYAKVESAEGALKEFVAEAETDLSCCKADGSELSTSMSRRKDSYPRVTQAPQ
jgi:hypothetical protein